MSHQHGLSNNGTETTGFTEPDDSDDRVQKESENVVHSRMVSNGRSSRIQDLWGIRLPQVTAHPIPTDLEAVKLLSSAPAVLDLFVWLSYRCFTSKGTERIPLFGPFGLVQQLGAVEYARPRRFREKLQQWLKTIRLVWPECPAEITADGENLRINPATSIHSSALPQKLRQI